MPKLDKYARITETVGYFGVCRNTIRNWGRQEKIQECRNPVNNYRLFKRLELEKALRRVERSAAKMAKAK